MPFGDNTTLITTAAAVDVVANNSADVYAQGATGATAFVIANGNVGDDTFIGFGSDDSIINNRRIFDGNGDGYIQFGPNGVLDVDRTSPGNAGPDQLQIVGPESNIIELRYLGSKGMSTTSGQHVYADSATRRNLIETYGSYTVVEGTVGDNTFDAGAGATILLHDNALGLNLGGDTVNGFGDDDLLVTTELLFDSNGDGTVTFAENDVLDSSAGDQGPQPSDPSGGPGGQLDLNDPDLLSVEYLGSNVIDGVIYYYYGTAGSTFDPTPSE